MADLPNVNAEEIGEFKAIAGSAEDGPVLMLNLNRYVEEANFPDGKLYHEYMTVLDQLLSCLLYTSPSPRDGLLSRMPSSA